MDRAIAYRNERLLLSVITPKNKSNSVLRLPSERPSASKPRTGGRSARVVHDVLEATLEEFARVGYSALSIEAVAQRAGVNKTTVYRRWPTKAELVRAALLSVSHHDDVPDTGSLRGDLLAILDRVVKIARSPRKRSIMRAFFAEQNEPDLADIGKSLRNKKMPSSIVDRAIARGELPAGADPELLLEIVMAPVRHRALVGTETIDDEFLKKVIDVVVRGAAAGALAPSRAKGRERPPASAKRRASRAT